MPEHLLHLLGGLEVELLRGILQTVGIVDIRACADTEQNVVGIGVFVLEIVDVVGADDRQVEFVGDLDELFIALDLFRKVVVLEFDIVVFRARTDRGRKPQALRAAS